MKELLDRIEHFGNRLTDADWSWWPFVFLRPEPDQLMDTRYVAHITRYFGPFYGLFFVGLLLLTSQLTLLGLALSIVGFPLCFFVAYRLTFAVAWNRRARSLQEQRKHDVRE